MRNFCCGLILLLATGVLFSCGSKTKDKKFFDLPGFFKGEIDSIKTNYLGRSKTVEYNGKTSDTHDRVDMVNWDKEFGLFLECDINKPVYYANMYQVTSSPHSDYLEEYVCTTKNLPVKKVIIDRQSGNQYPEGIKILVEKSNLLTTSKMELTYEILYSKRDGILRHYSISGLQSIIGIGDESRFKVDGIIFM